MERFQFKQHTVLPLEEHPLIATSKVLSLAIDALSSGNLHLGYRAVLHTDKVYPDRYVIADLMIEYMGHLN